MSIAFRMLRADGEIAQCALSGLAYPQISPFTASDIVYGEVEGVLVNANSKRGREFASFSCTYSTVW